MYNRGGFWMSVVFGLPLLLLFSRRIFSSGFLASLEVILHQSIPVLFSAQVGFSFTTGWKSLMKFGFLGFQEVFNDCGDANWRRKGMSDLDMEGIWIGFCNDVTIGMFRRG